MRNMTRTMGAALVLLAVVTTGCQTTHSHGRGKVCIDVAASGAGDAEAAVYVDGIKEGDVSMVKGKGFFLFSSAEKHMIKVEAEGFETYEKEIRVHPGKTTWVNIRLKEHKPEAPEPPETPVAPATPAEPAAS